MRTACLFATSRFRAQIRDSFQVSTQKVPLDRAARIAKSATCCLVPQSLQPLSIRSQHPRGCSDLGRGTSGESLPQHTAATVPNFTSNP